MNCHKNRYINDAIDYYNRIQKRAILEKKLKKESDLVKTESMSVLKDFVQSTSTFSVSSGQATPLW